VKLQPAGRRAFERARTVAMDLQDQVLTALPATRRGKFLEELEAIAEACGTALEKSALKLRR
jgi:hypothetical protein